MHKYNCITMATPLYDAIMQLRPEFGIRAWLDDIIRNKPNNTYFCTISREIAMIISNMVPDLRQTGEQALAKTSTAFAEFMDKYREDYPFTTLALKRSALIRDFPHYINEFMDRFVSVKFIAGNLRVTYNQNDKYVGNGAFYCKRNNLGPAQYPFIIGNGTVKMLSMFVPEFICVLPCGLVLEYRNNHTTYLVDYNSDDQPAILVPEIRDSTDHRIYANNSHYVDDYGALHQANDYRQLLFSELNPLSLLASLI